MILCHNETTHVLALLWLVPERLKYFLFSYSGSLSDKRFIFTSNGKNNAFLLIYSHFTFLFKYFPKSFEK